MKSLFWRMNVQIFSMFFFWYSKRKIVRYIKFFNLIVDKLLR